MAAIVIALFVTVMSISVFVTADKPYISSNLDI